MPEKIYQPTEYSTRPSLLSEIDTAPLTDAAPTRSVIVPTDGLADLLVSVHLGKGGTVVITPLPNVDDESVAGKASDTVTIANGGGKERIRYQQIGAPKARVTVTKTEAGEGTLFLAIRGVA